MKTLIFCLSIALIHGAPKPQYSNEEVQDISSDNLETIAEIFGTNGKQTDAGYGADTTGELNDGSVDVLVQVVQDNFPDDYVEQSDNLVEDKATVEVDTVFENCADYTEEFGYECVPYYQCSNGTIITDGAGLIDIRNGFAALQPEDSKCPGFLEVCCKDPDFIPPPPPPVVIKYQPQCGRRNQHGLGARIQGFSESESQFGEWPHMCAVLHEQVVEQEAGYAGEQETVNLYQCGGSLIAPGVVLTAAHCVDKFRTNSNELKIRCGEWDTQTSDEPRPHQDRKVDSLAIHPEFNGRNLQNDFAVLFTSEEFELDQHIDTACLPAPGETFEGTTCFATGWGKDQFGAAGQYQVVLKEIDLPVVSNGQCEDSLRSTRLGQKFKLDNSFLCAGGIAGKDTCKGDGGSPLVCPSASDPDTYIQAGIVAWGIGCGETGTPGVYADVSKATCWIDSVVTCHQAGVTGDYSSYFGYTTDVCQTWMDNKMADLETKREAAGNYGKVFDAIIDAYNQCNVEWATPTAPLIADLERDTADGGYGDVNGDNYAATNEKQVDDSYSADQKTVEDDGYPDTSVDIDADNERLVDPDPGYDQAQPTKESHVDPYGGDSEKLIDPAPTEAPIMCSAPPVKLASGYTDDTAADLTKDSDDIADVANPY